MTKQIRTGSFLLFFFAQLIAGGTAALVWPMLLNLVHAGTGDFMVGACILFVGILAFAIFLILGKKEGFLRLVEMEQLSARNIFLFAFSFLVATLIGLTASDILSYFLRNRAATPDGVTILYALCVGVPFLVFDLNLLIGGRLVRFLTDISARVANLGEKMSRLSSHPFLKRALLFLSKPWLASLFWTIAFFGIFFSLFRIGYAVDDDIALISIVSGYLGGSTSQFLVHGNVTIGFLMKYLYGLHIGQNWFILFLIQANFLSVWALIGLIFTQRIEAGSKFFGSLAIILCDIYFLVNITYTVVAAFACLAGLGLLISAALSSSQNRKLFLLFGSTLILLGSLIRFEAALMISLIVVPVVLITYRSFHLRTLIFSLFVAGVLVIFGYAFNRIYVGSNPDWDRFYLYTRTRATLHDTPRITNLAGTYQQVGWSSNDLNSFANWFFPDPELYSLQNLRSLVEHTPQERVNLRDALGFLSERLFSLVSLPYLFLLVAVWLWMGLSEIPAKKILLPAILAGCTTLGMDIYLAVAMKIPNRVLLPSLTATILVGFIYFISFAPNRTGVRLHHPGSGRVPWFGLSSLSLSLLLAVGLVLGQTILTSRTNIKRQATYREAVAELNALQEQGVILPDALIVSPAYGLPLAWSDPLTMEFPSIQYLDMGWLTFSPSYEAVLREFDIQSLVRGLYEKENVYVMATPSLMENVRKFILEHEGVEVDANILYEMPAGAAGTAYEQAALYKLVIKK
jgi:hypothetical protein